MRWEPGYGTRELHDAGERVAAGVYRDVRTGREIRLEAEDRLPGSLDGRVACYVLVRSARGGEAPTSADREVTDLPVSRDRLAAQDARAAGSEPLATPR
jgi:hypothetical protein